MTTLERGFKSWSERLSESIRRDLGLAPIAPLPAEQLASYLEVRLLRPQDIPGLPEDARAQLLEADPWGWSAVTQIIGGVVTVIYNPRHSAGRRASNIAHELAHVLLAHETDRIILSEDGQIAMRTFDAQQEDEANWLAGSLLLPRAGLLRAVKSGESASAIAEAFGVSEALVTYRSRVTGVGTQASRAARFARGRQPQSSDRR